MSDQRLARARWRKSSHSGSGDECVEVAALGGGDRAVRDSTDPGGPALVFAAPAWRAFLRELRAAAR